MSEKLLKRGDVVQIVPESNPVFGGCLAIVDEPKSFGAQLYVVVPHKDGPQMACYRASAADLELVGHAAYVPDTSASEPIVEPIEVEPCGKESDDRTH
jgi:hypothetical protein